MATTPTRTTVPTIDELRAQLLAALDAPEVRALYGRDAPGWRRARHDAALGWFLGVAGIRPGRP